jgi:aspartyl aminopeptidase
MRLLEDGKTPFQVVEFGRQYLQNLGFEELNYKKRFEVVPNGSYYVSPYPSALFAFHIGNAVTAESMQNDTKVKIAMAHTDFPCFKIKSQPEYVTKKYLQANVEPYGGMIKSTWFDRPLGIAGKVVLAGESVYDPKVVLFDSKRPLFVIPSLAPHLDREANKNRDYDMQQELQPIVGMLREQCNKDGFLMEYLANELGVSVEAILSFDLYLYNADKPETIGLNGEFISAPRLDNLASVSALLEAIGNVSDEKNISMIALFDNEEIGSRSKQGADSQILTMIMKKIADALSVDEIALNDCLSRGFLLSVDGAHALHPNYVAKSDITNEVFLTKGVVIKTSASQRYLSDSEAIAVLKELCRQNQIAYQVQVNRSGMPGGQTLGPIAASYLPMQGADLGIPMLAMHSSREMAAGEDYEELLKLLKAFL